MKRRFFAMLLSLAMLFTLAPTAFAAENENVISSDTTWASETTLDHDLTINSGKTLTVNGLITIQGTVKISGGGTIKRGSDYKNYMIVVPEGSTLTLKNITIDGGAAWSDDANKDNTLNRGTTNNGIKATSAMIYNFGKLIVTDGAVLQNNDNTTKTGAIATKDQGTGKYTFPSVTDKVQFGGAVLNGGKMKITGGSIQDNSVAWRGAGVASYGSIEMSGGTVQRNFAQNQYGDGGAFYLHGAKNTSEEGSAYCTISGGQLTANKAGGAGGAVCADGQSILNVSGGSFENNVAATTGGGINVYFSNLNMSDGTISGNSAAKGGGLNLIKGSKATITGGNITSNKAENGGGIQVDDNSKLDASDVMIEENQATNNGGGIYAPGAENKKYSISLNGVSVKDNKAGTSSENSGVGGGICASRAWRQDSSTGVLTLTNSKITGNRGANGGGIYLDAGITATMDGGEISGNIASTTSTTKHPSGGGIQVNGTFTMNSGEISNNIKDGQWSGGAGAFVSGTFTMNGGEVSRNIDTCTAEEAHTIGGGAFYVMGGTLNIHGGNITGNASYRGGAIAFHNGPYERGTVNITGGTITGNYCTTGTGGAIYMPTAAKGTQTFNQLVCISGNPVIAGNYKGAVIASNEGVYTIDPTNATTENNIYLGLNKKNGTNAVSSEYADRQTLILGELTNGASIGVTTETPLTNGRKVQITSTEADTEYYKDAAQYFIPDAANVVAQANEGKYVELAHTTDTYRKVTLNLSHASVSIGSPTTMVKDGKSCTITIKADEGYTLPAVTQSGVTYARSNDKTTASVMVTPTVDITVAIEAVPNTYTVAFDGNGSTDEPMGTQIMTYDATYNLTANAYTKTGCNFAGWSTTQNGSCEYPNEASVKNLTAENGGTVTLYAIWTEKQVIPAFSSSAIQSYKYDGSAKAYTLTSDIKDFIITYKQGETTVSEPTNVGTYDVIISRQEDTTYAAFSQTINGGLVITKVSSGSSSSGSSNPTYSVTTPSKSENGKVSLDKSTAKKGDTVTVTVTPDAGYQLDKLTVTDKNGTVLKLTDKGDGKYSFTMPDGKVEVKAVFAKEVETSPFGDVSTDAYYYKAVQWAQEKGITDGISSDLFGPNQPCTRGQIVTFLWRAAGSPEPKSTAAGMTDVVSGSYYEKAVAWAVENGITTGTAEGTFSPDATCTRAQAVTFLARAQNAKATGKTAFSDVPADSYFADAVAWAQANGVTTGTSETTFSPDSDCTRAQIVTFLYRANQGT